MKAFILMLSFLLFWLPGYGQFADFFNDGDFDQNPAWTGDSADFVVNNEVLRLNAPAVSGTKQLALNSEVIEQATWKFEVFMEFNPSSNNYAEVYLVADTIDLTSVGKGYVVKLGGTPDEVSLYRVDGASTTKIIDGIDGRLSLSSVAVQIEVTRDAFGQWQLFSQLSSELEPVLEGEVFDDSILASNSFGFVCHFTSTRSAKFGFDKVEVMGQPFTDRQPPKLTLAQIPTANQIELGFNEPMETNSLLDLSNFVRNTNGLPDQVVVNGDSSLTLSFSTPHDLTNELSISGVSDLTGNVLDTLVHLVFVDPVPASYREVVINEMMVDPTPREDLPEVEYLEILNMSEKVIDLSGWQLSDKVTTSILPDYLLFPGDMLLLCAKSAEEALSGYGSTLGISNWPSLNNAGDDLYLRSPDSTLVDQVSYTMDWYYETIKNNGGWALEQIYPKHNCPSSNNWQASVSPLGGTPGAQNSVFQNSDASSPMLLQHSIRDQEIALQFNEQVNSSNIEIFLSPSSTSFSFIDSAQNITLKSEQSLNKSQPYLLEITGIEDCNGNPAAPIVLEFVITDMPNPKDILINELLFNPRPNGVDFIELYNNSNKYFDLADLRLSNGQSEKTVSDSSLLFQPFSYLVLTPDIAVLDQEYVGSTDSYVDAAIPSMNNDSGDIIVASRQGTRVDSVHYDESQHQPLLTDVEGVSLERISHQIASVIAQNWTSATSSAGFATPGYENSQHQMLTTSQIGLFLDPQVIIPDNNGHDDQTTLSYNLSKTGFLANIKVFDLNGHLVKMLANNETLGFTGLFLWDGTNDNGTVVSSGHYIMVSDLFHMDGNRLVFKHKIVVSPAF